MHQKRAAPQGSPFRLCTGSPQAVNVTVHRESGALEITNDEAVRWQ